MNFYHLGQRGTLRRWECAIDRNGRISDRELTAFPSKPPALEHEGPPLYVKTLTLPSSACKWFPYLQFKSPEVYIELRYGPYTLKCRYLTKLYMYMRDWWRLERECTVVIDSVEVTLTDLLKWRCACNGTKCSADIPIPLKPFKGGSNYTLTCLYRYNDPIYSEAFVFYASKDMDVRKNRVSELGEPAVASFILSEISEEIAPAIKKERPEPFNCTEYFATKPRRYVNKGSGRCKRRLCGHCCDPTSCSKHKRCMRQKVKNLSMVTL